jgi:hypothetical protein
MGDFETAHQYAMRGVQTWRSGNVQTHAEDYIAPVVACLVYVAQSEWHFGEIASCRAAIAEAILIAKEVKDMNALALALAWAAGLAHCARNPAEVDRLTSELIELSTRQNFAYWLATGAIWRGWARSASGNRVEGISCIERGIRDYRATCTVLAMPSLLALKAEALHLANRTSEAVEAINEAEALAERHEQRDYSAELHRLRGVFLATLGADEAQIEASFCEAIRIAKSRSRFRYRNAQKQPTQNIGGKKRAR